MSIADEAGDEEPKSEDYKDLLVTYRAMVDAMRKGNELTLTGQKDKFDITRYHRLEIKVNALWPKLLRWEHCVACAELVKTVHMPQKYADILTIFNGKIHMEEPVEPCLKL